MKRATIKDIARDTGVSKSTISHALNNTRYVKQETKDKILEVVKKYNYRPNLIAKAIKTKKTKTIALIVHSLSPFSKNIALIDGIEKKATENGYSISIFNTRVDIQKKEKIIDTIDEKIIDGVILAVSDVFNGKLEKEIIYELKKRNIPLFFLEDSTDTTIPIAIVDGYLGGKIAGEFLLGNNHRDIGVITHNQKLSLFKNRVKGILDILDINGIKEKFVIELNILSDSFEILNNYLDKIKEVFLKEKVTAIFCTTDIIAISLLQVLKSNNIKVPEDISIMGFDNHPISKIVTPKLSTIENDLFKLGEIAVDNIIAKIEKGSFLERKTIMKPSIIIRDSVIKL